MSIDSSAWADLAWTPADNHLPTLHFDDVSSIPFIKDVVGIEVYQLRARVRARTGDLYTATCPEVEGYEDYCQEFLGLGSPTYLQAHWDGNLAEVALACMAEPTLDRLASWAREQGGVALHPYMGTPETWQLARQLATRSGVRVGVLAPPPEVTWHANDKIAFTRLVEEVLGTWAVVPTRNADNAADLAIALESLAKEHEQVALKLSRCASAMGNRVFDATELIDTQRMVESFLADKEWTPGDPVLAVAWMENDLSPSSQVWIPAKGDPVVDGVYEQLLEGPEKVFLGSVPARFEQQLKDKIADMSVAVARAYQQLGYVGRCSFDFIVVDGSPLFVECNGRWGGTSTPMHLMDRLFDQRPAYRARDFVHPKLAGRPFSDIVDRLSDVLYDARTGQGRFVLYNAGCQPDHGKIDVIARGDTVADATEALEQEFAERVAGL
jgi:hypothetical protein